VRGGSELTVRAYQAQEVVPGGQRAVGGLRDDPGAVLIAAAERPPGHARAEQDLPAGVRSDDPVAAQLTRDWASTSGNSRDMSDREYDDKANTNQDLVCRHASLRWSRVGLLFARRSLCGGQHPELQAAANA
jgi:hypothetical protein